MNKTKIFMDIETGDPDDILTLIYCLGIDEFEIVGITIFPGSARQIQLVKFILNRFNLDIPIGLYDYEKKYEPGKWYTKAFGRIPKIATKAVDAYKLMLAICDEDTILYTGGPNKNLGKALQNGELKIKAWFAQGGFAGDNIVPEEYILPKFKGKQTCATWNFGGLVKETKLALSSKNIPIRYLCSKNVCHSILYDDKMHAIFKTYLDTNEDNMSQKYLSIKLFYQAMINGYGNKRNKKMHDLLPVVCIRDLTVCTWAQVELYTREDKNKSEWGSNFSQDSNTFICINYDKPKFLEYLTK